jgi:hypothetical protein
VTSTSTMRAPHLSISHGAVIGRSTDFIGEEEPRRELSGDRSHAPMFSRPPRPGRARAARGSSPPWCDRQPLPACSSNRSEIEPRCRHDARASGSGVKHCWVERRGQRCSVAGGLSLSGLGADNASASRARSVHAALARASARSCGAGRQIRRVLAVYRLRSWRVRGRWAPRRPLASRARSVPREQLSKGFSESFAQWVFWRPFARSDKSRVRRQPDFYASPVGRLAA